MLQITVCSAGRGRPLQNVTAAPGVSPLTLIRCQAQEEEHYIIIGCLMVASSENIWNLQTKNKQRGGAGIFTQITRNLDVANQKLNEYLVTLGKYLNLIFVKRR